VTHARPTNKTVCHGSSVRVSTPVSGSGVPVPAGEGMEPEPELRSCARPRRPNPNVCGPEWM
jgi:hypothetical protein